ncbi:MAG: hypothetical protein KC609_08905 [Myxococcales bacterium]|nr:hypothetical protein [Myxococcales bacterium]
MSETPERTVAAIRRSATDARHRSVAIRMTVLALLLCAAPLGCSGSGGQTTERSDAASSTDVSSPGPDATSADSGDDDCSGCGPQTCENKGDEHDGEGTYYVEADGSGNCGFPATPNDLMVGAMNQTDYQDSAVCGSCVHIVGPKGEIDVRIVDRCPECAPGDIDLSPSAFDRIAEHSAGRVPIRWWRVPCEVSGPIRYHYKDGSNPWWLAVQIRNHRHPIATVEYRAADGRFVEMERTTYNYFLEPKGLGDGPYHFRVTDIFGQQIEDANLPFKENTEYSSSSQFPACP